MKIGINIQTIFESIDKPANDIQKEIIKKLQTKGHKISIVITTPETEVLQDEITRKQRVIIEEWLKANDITYDEIVITKENDRDICVNNSINYMVRDILNQETYESISKLTGYPSIDKPWLKYYSEEEQKLELPHMTLFEYVQRNNQNNLNGVAINYFGVKITYSKLFEQIERVKKALIEKGVEKGDTISLASINCPEFIYAFYAINQIGAIANIINPMKKSNEINKILLETNSKLFICCEMENEIIHMGQNEISSMIEGTKVKKVIVYKPTNSLPPFIKKIISLKEKRKIHKMNDTLNWDDFICNEKVANEILKTNVDNEEASCFVYTSGTTGKSKAVMLTNNNINSELFQLLYSGPKSLCGQKYLDIIPPWILFGLVCGIHNSLSLGQELILIPQYQVDIFINSIIKNKPNHIICVPAFFNAFTKDKRVQKMDLSFLKSIILGGDVLPANDEQRFNEFLYKHGANIKVATGFGMTEFSTSATYTKNGEIMQPGSVGVPLLKTSTKIIDSESEVIKSKKYYEIGEICLSGPTLMKGYFGSPELSAQVLKRHDDASTLWMHTGDLGYVSNNGELFVCGRTKRMIVKQNGVKFAPFEIEKTISSISEVEQCVVVQSYNENGGGPKAFIVLNEYCKNCENKILEKIKLVCKSGLNPDEIPISYEFIDILPINSANKVDIELLEKSEKTKANTSNCKKLVLNSSN